MGTVFHDDVLDGQVVELSGAYMVTTFSAEMEKATGQVVTNVYVASDTSATVSCFTENDSSGIVYLGAAKSPECQGPRSVTVTPDGRHAYAACGYSDAIAIFSREQSGFLTAIEVIKHGERNNAMQIDSLNFPLSVTTAPTGENVYVASGISNSVTSFARDNSTGFLSLLGFRTSDGLTKARCRHAF